VSEAETLSGRTAWARSIETPLRKLLRTQTGSAVVLLGAAVAALVWANADAGSYERVWQTTLSIRVGHAGIDQDLRHWLNGGLMALHRLRPLGSINAPSLRRGSRMAKGISVVPPPARQVSKPSL
jgi:hypothetical protein